MRRGEALKMRKDLIDIKSIVSGYVAYPAKLFVKRSHGSDVPYVLEKDFSKMDVSEKIKELRNRRQERQDRGSNDIQVENRRMHKYIPPDLSHLQIVFCPVYCLP